MAIETIRTFLGWCTVINLGLFILSSILIIAIRGIASRFHAKLFGLDEKFISQAYFQYLGQYKIAVIVFNIVPYFALKVMG